MFDLFRSRETAVRYLLGGLLMVVAVSMVVTLIPGFGTNSVTTGDNPTLANIAGDKLTAQEALGLFQRAIQGQNLPQELESSYFNQFVGNLIQQRAAAYQAEKMGITASDDEVLDSLVGQYPQLFPNGVMIPKDQFQLALAQQGLTPQDLVDETRSRILLGKLESTLTQSVVVTPQEIEQNYKEKNMKVKLQYIAFPPGKFLGDVKVNDADLQGFYKSNQQAYMKPAEYNFQLIVLDQDKLEAATQVSDAQLRQTYAASMDNFRTPERVRARHILIKTEGKSDSEKKTLLTKAQDLLKKAKGGADFADLAKANSEDAGSATKGGDLDFFVRGQMVPEFEKSAFSMKINEISDIVTTQFGYHIIQVTGKEAAKVKSFDEVKTDLAAQLKHQMVADKMQTSGDQIRNAWMKTPDAGAKIAKDFGADLITVPNSKAGDPIPTIGVSPEIITALSQTKAGEFSNPIALPSNRIAVAHLLGGTPATPKAFEEVKEQVRNYAIGMRAEPFATDKAKEAAAKIQNGEDIAAVARAYKMDLVTTSEFSPPESVDGIGPASAVREAFRKPVGSVIGPITIQGRPIIAKVVSQTLPDMSLLPAERGSILDSLREQKVQSRARLFADSVTERLRADGKLTIDDSAIQRVVRTLTR